MDMCEREKYEEILKELCGDIRGVEWNLDQCIVSKDSHKFVERTGSYWLDHLGKCPYWNEWKKCCMWWVTNNNENILVKSVTRVEDPMCCRIHSFMLVTGMTWEFMNRIHDMF